MTSAQIIRKVMEIKEVRPSVLASRIGIKNNVLSERLGQKNMSVAKLNETLRPLDYKIIVVPRECRIPEGGFELE